MAIASTGLNLDRSCALPIGITSRATACRKPLDLLPPFYLMLPNQTICPGVESLVSKRTWRVSTFRDRGESLGYTGESLLSGITCAVNEKRSVGGLGQTPLHNVGVTPTIVSTGGLGHDELEDEYCRSEEETTVS